MGDVRVGVTGSSGLIGSALVAALERRGDDVVAFVRPSSTLEAKSVVRWDPGSDVLDANELRRAGELHAMVNLAGAGIGERRWSPERKLAILTSRVRATALLVRALRETPNEVRVLASASAVGWYGDRGNDVLDESSTRGTGYLADVCDAWESAACSSAPDGVVVARLRTGLVLSTNGGALKKQLGLFRLGLGGAFASGRQWQSPVSLEDTVRAILWVIDRQLSGPVNLVAPTPLTNRDFTRALARALGRPAILRVPRAALELALGKEMAHELLLVSQRVVPHTLTASGFTFHHPDAASALAWALASTS